MLLFLDLQFVIIMARLNIVVALHGDARLQIRMGLTNLYERILKSL